MNKLLEAAKAVLNQYSKSRSYLSADIDSDVMEALRQALQADGIGDAVQESHMQDEPSIDALIAEIDGITEYAYDDFKLVECLPKAKVIAILDKYRE